MCNLTVKEKEDAHQDPEIQPMKEDDGTFGEYRWEMDKNVPAVKIHRLCGSILDSLRPSCYKVAERLSPPDY